MTTTTETTTKLQEALKVAIQARSNYTATLKAEIKKGSNESILSYYSDLIIKCQLMISDLEERLVIYSK